MVWACSQGDPSPPYIPDPPAKEGGTSFVDSGGGDGPAVTCTGGDGGCNSLTNCATKAYITEVPQDAPAATGGTVPDGTYVLTSYIAYTGLGGASGQQAAWFRETMKLTTEATDGGPTDGGAIQQMVWLDISATNADTQDSTSSGTTFFSASASVEFDKACSSISQSTYGYSVSGTQMLLYIQNGNNVGELTYTKQ